MPRQKIMQRGEWYTHQVNWIMQSNYNAKISRLKTRSLQLLFHSKSSLDHHLNLSSDSLFLCLGVDNRRWACIVDIFWSINHSCWQSISRKPLDEFADSSTIIIISSQFCFGLFSYKSLLWSNNSGSLSRDYSAHLDCMIYSREQYKIRIDTRHPYLQHCPDRVLLLTYHVSKKTPSTRFNFNLNLDSTHQGET